MLRFGLLTLVSGALQLFVPSYGLRLVRRFGARQVGWFLVVAFASLALAHLLEPLKPHNPGSVSGLTTEAIYAAASVLLLIGMGHIESLFSERGRIAALQKSARSSWKSRLEQSSASWQELQQEVATLKETTAALRDSEAQYRLLFMENPQPMWIFDLRALRFLAVNKTARRLYGMTPEELGGGVTGVFPPESAAAFRQDAAKPCAGAEFRGCWQHRRRDGTVFDVEITAADLTYAGCPARLILATEVSKRQRRELEFAQAHKMELIARISDRFAHHFNNLLTTIDSHAALLLHKPQGPRAVEQVKQISIAAGRATALTRQLVAAGGRQFVQMEPLNLNTTIQDLRPMLRRLLHDSIILECSGVPDLPPILADAHSLEAMIVSLVLNARDAMPSGGTLRISTKGARFDAGQSPADSEGRVGAFACLTISDTGCGIAPEIQPFLFEPFFTTREGGNRTGLGLPSVYGAVKQHSGWLDYSTQVGAGTEFRIFLPVAPASSGPAKNATPTIGASSVRQTILLVEGDERTRGMAHFVLSGQGHRVIEADSAATALLLFEGQGEKVDLLLINMNLPEGMPGQELAKRLCQGKPGLKVLYTCEGEAVSEDGAAAILAEGAAFIPQPYTPDKLLRAVQAGLNKEG